MPSQRNIAPQRLSFLNSTPGEHVAKQIAICPPADTCSWFGDWSRFLPASTELALQVIRPTCL